MSTRRRLGPRVPTWLLLTVGLLVLVAAPSGVVWAAHGVHRVAPTPAIRPSDPTTLTIDSLGLRGIGVLPMALKQGALNPPDNPRMVGWWNHSADAGAATGTTLLTAHKVHSGSAVFEHLVDLRPGATIVLGGDTGAFTYVVADVRVLTKDQLAAESGALFAQDGPHRLVLVTCEDWDGTEFAANSVVTALPAPASPVPSAAPAGRVMSAAPAGAATGGPRRV
ncbi:class F sortase [Raineyella sp.]|uniref:class F sortase n=1 Tax=Raineyella sp. TaxID=1911550 RepID=UPI002B1FE5D9|nr:class F sortase [Raineyella sp.]MEA5155749.1 class F sortase [Raineyella sp.]